MYSTSTQYKQAVQQLNRVWALRITVYLDSGDTLNLTDRDISLNSLTFKESSTCDNNLQIGSVYSNSLDFAISNRDNLYMSYDYSNALVTAEVGLEVEDSFEYVPLGLFYVNSIGKKRSTIPLKCLDGLSKANRPLADAGLTFPITLAAAFSKVCTTCGLNYTTELYAKAAEWLDTILEFDVSKYSCRDFLSFAAVLMGCNLRVNRMGLLEDFWYSSVNTTTTTDTRVKESEYDDLEVSVTGISYKTLEDEDALVGTEGYILQLKENPLLYSDDQIQEVAQNVLSLLSNVVYRPCTVYSMGDPAWQAGDLVSHVQKDSSIFIAPIMQHVYRYRGSSTLKALGQTQESDRQLTSSAKTLLRYEARAKRDLNQGLTAMQQIILSQSSLLTSALGFYPHAEYESDGSLKGVYLMSTPFDSETTTVWAITGGGIGVSHTGIGGPYTSTWTVDDTIVANTVNANMIRTGVLQDNNGGNTFYLDLDNGILRMGSYYTKEESDQQIAAYLRFIDGKLYIGKAESNIQLVETNDKVAFVDKASNTEVAYISNDRFYTPNITVLQTADFGGYRMDVSSGIAFKWIGRE